MRKLLGITLFVAVAAIFSSCEKKYEYYGSDPIPYDLSLKSFITKPGLATSTLGYYHPIRFDEGMSVFVYFLEGTYGNGEPVWAPLPAKYFIDLTQGSTTTTAEIEYSTAFSREELFLTARSFQGLDLFKSVKDGNGTISYTDDLTFRVVYIPGPYPMEFSASSVGSEDGTIPYEVLEKKYNLQNARVGKMYPSK